MEDFKNENEYGNIKTDDEAYEGVLLKTGDEGYRYYSSELGDITLTSYYQSETSSTAIITMNASCPNAECIYIRLLKTNGEIIYSSGASATTISRQKSFMSAGTYIVEAEAYGGNGTTKIKRTEIEVTTATGPVYNCENCYDKGWFTPTSRCTACEAWETNFAPTVINYTYESTTSSTFNVTMNAICYNAYNMYIRLKNANGVEVNNSSQGTSGTSISKTVTFLCVGTYTIEVELIAADGRRKTDELTFELEYNSEDGSGSYETLAKSSDCSYCNGTGLIGNIVCTNCRHSNEHLSDITITYSNEADLLRSVTEESDSEQKYNLRSTVNCENAWNIYATLVDNATNESKGSIGASATSVTATFNDLHAGKYRMEARAISASGMEKYKNEIIDVPYIGAAPAEQDEPTFWYNVVGHNHTAGTYSISFSSYYSGAARMQVDINTTGGELVYTTGDVIGNVVINSVELPEGEYRVVATAYTWSNVHPSPPKTIIIPVYDMNIVIDDPIITAKEDGTYDVAIAANTVMANNMYLKVLDENGVEEYSYEISSNSFDVTFSLTIGNYTIVVNSVYYEGTICRAGKKERPITVGPPVGGDDTTTTPEVEDDTNITYNIQYVGNNTFNLTINYSGEKTIKYNVIPKYIRNPSITANHHSGTYTESTQIDLYEGVYRIDITEVEGNELLKKQLFAVEEIKDKSGNVTDRVIHYNTAQPERKFLLLYVAGGETAFQENEVANIVQTTGATDVVILTNCPINHYNNGTDNDLIMSSEKIDNWISEKETDEYPFKPTNKDAIILEMKNAVSAVEESGKENYNNYIHCIKSLKDLLLLANSNLKIWVGIPQMLSSEGIGNCQPAAELYIEYYKLLVNKVMCEFKNDDSFEGFYYGDEVVATWYTEFNYGNSGNFNNVVVKNMSSVSNYIRNTKKKKFMWIPFYQVVNESGDDNVVKRTRSIVNELELFDYIILQPSSYFNYYATNKVPAENIEYVRKCVEQGICLTKAEAQASYEDTYAKENVLGMEMEIDDAIDLTGPTGEEARALYGEYVFQYLVMKKKDAPVAFYAGVTASVNNTNVLNEISELYNN